jgi:hypothetical protein
MAQPRIAPSPSPNPKPAPSQGNIFSGIGNALSNAGGGFYDMTHPNAVQAPKIG